MSRASVVQGGYRQWLAEGLPAKEGASDYAASPADVIGEQVALLAGTTGSSLCAPFSFTQADWCFARAMSCAMPIHLNPLIVTGLLPRKIVTWTRM